MILDSSAVVGILRGGPEALLTVLDSARNRRMAAATLVELCMVTDSSRDPVKSARVDGFLRRSDVEIIEVTADQAYIARTAHRDFAKGSGNPARLNFGDCFALALATVTGEPLLFKGDDFGHPDLTPAVRG